MNDLFRGDEVYSIDCTGDAVVGDEVKFSKASFRGSWRHPKFDGYEIVEGKIIRDSYGSDRGQHTFTVEDSDGFTTKIKGRNLYRNGLYRKAWNDEDLRLEALEEKHSRGTEARQMRRNIRNGVGSVWGY